MQRPKLHVVVTDVQVRHEAVRIHVDVPVRHHDALGSRRGAGRVVDRHQVVFVPFNWFRSGIGLIRNQRLPVEPTRTRFNRSVPILGNHEMTDRGELGANVVDDTRVLVVHQHDRHPCVTQDVLVVRRHKSVIERHQHGTDPARGVEALEKEVRVRTQDADAVIRLDAETQQRMRQPVYARLQLRVRVAPITVHHRRLVRIKMHGTAQKIVGEERNLMNTPVNVRFRSDAIAIGRDFPAEEIWRYGIGDERWATRTDPYPEPRTGPAVDSSSIRPLQPSDLSRHPPWV